MSESTAPHSVREIRDWLTTYVARLLGVATNEVDPAYSFEAYGIDSSAAVGLSGDLGDLLGVQLDTSIAYDFPTINTVVEHLVSSKLIGPGSTSVPPRP